MSIRILNQRHFIVIVALLLCSCAQVSDRPTELTRSEVIPDTCEAAIRKIAQELDEESVQILKETSKEDLVQFHMTWGMGIRNSYGLWTEESQLRKSCAKRAGLDDIHPDNASGIIMEGVWKYVNEMDI